MFPTMYFKVRHIVPIHYDVLTHPAMSSGVVHYDPLFELTEASSDKFHSLCYQTLLET